MAELIINDQWRIVSYTYGWKLERDLGRVDKKGAPVREIIGYYSTIGAAAKALLERDLRLSDARGIVEFQQRIDRMSYDIARAVEVVPSEEVA